MLVRVFKPLLVGPKFLQDSQRMVEFIQQRLSATLDRQRAYADQRSRDVSFVTEDLIFLKVSLTKQGILFGRWGKLSP